MDLLVGALELGQIKVFSLDPATLVPHDVLVVQLGDRLDFLHRWVVKDGALLVGVELDVKLHLLQGIHPVIEFVTNLGHGAAPTFSDEPHRFEGLLETPSLQERPQLAGVLHHVVLLALR